MTLTVRDGYQLFHDGTKALSQVEANGIRIDVDYIDREIEKAEKKINKLGEQLREDKIWKLWRRRYGDKANLSSREQLSTILFKDMGLECKNWTEGRTNEQGGIEKRPKADETALRDTELPFVENYLRREKLIKAKNTFLWGIKREVHNGRLRTFFNLAGGTSDDTKGDPRTYRSSTDSPNVQNFPIRDAEMGKLIRRAFIPSKGNVLIEADFKGIEVSIAYCYHKDPVMKRYLLDKSSDMHRDMAIQCYKLEKAKLPDGWWKAKGSGGGHDVRYAAKNKYVFPQFYGDYYINCAKNLWEDIDRLKLCLPDGTSLKEWLATQGIKKLGKCDPSQTPKPGTFENHLQEVERHFWTKRFGVYGQWKKDWYNKFCERGWFQMKTGFVCKGTYTRNQVINYPVQGAAFHCLLWSLIRLQKWLNDNNMRTLIVSQIHDSILLDAPPDEVEAVVHKLQSIMREELLEEWSWIIIPLEVEIEVAEINWFNKHEYKSS